MRKKIIFLVILLIMGWGLFFPSSVRADQVEDLKNKITEIENKLLDIGKQKNSLSQQISLMDNQIKLTTLKISQTEVQVKNLEKEIESLSGKIVRLDGSLNYLSKILLSRVSETYKKGKLDRFLLILSSKSFADFISQSRYLQAVQTHDREMLLTMEQTRTSFDEQKQLKEKKQADREKLKNTLESQKKTLNDQIIERKRLLEETRGQEVVYQKLLADAKAELEAILGILEGKGNEKEIKKVSEGTKIATLIQGASCNSSGTHLHFMVVQSGEPVNPFSVLKSGIDYENCSGGSCGGGDSFNPSGNWNWPLDPRIRLTQGYGLTWAILHTPWLRGIYDFHNGLDLASSSLSVKAVKPGTLYWGNFVGKCTLKYVKIRHDEGNIDTYYLHVNY